MPTVGEAFFREQLLTRRNRLKSLLARGAGSLQIDSLMAEVDAAFARLEKGTFGICQACQGGIELPRLMADPLTRFCLEDGARPVVVLGRLSDFAPQELERLEADLELAGRIQRGLLPPKSLTTNGWEVEYHYEPLGTVSGDYCDLIVLDPPIGQLLFLLGDVSGKGVSAALLMSHLHAMFRSLVTTGLPLGQMLSVANRLFFESAIAGQYATLVAGRAHARGCLELAGAGHPPGILVRTKGVSRLESPTLPLGMFSDPCFTTQQVDLQRGDTLILYSDGVTELRTSSSEEYGLERLTQFAQRQRGSSARETVAACLSELEEFSSGHPRGDDLTLMALRRVG